MALCCQPSLHTWGSHAGWPQSWRAWLQWYGSDDKASAPAQHVPGRKHTIKHVPGRKHTIKHVPGRKQILKHVPGRKHAFNQVVRPVQYHASAMAWHVAGMQLDVHTQSIMP